MDIEIGTLIVDAENLETEFKEFERRLKFKLRLKYSWFHLKLYSMFTRFKPALNLNWFLADLGRGSNSLNSDTDSTI